MTQTERDTHFQGFARLSWEDVRSKVHFVTNTGEEYLDERVIALLAQHTYDLAYHVLYCDGIDAEYHEQKNGSALYHQEVMKRLERIPDLKAWPED